MGISNVDNAPPNFAQAALLLQNSSCVYSRKVEYLYSLVYAALNELIASTRNTKSDGSGKKRNSSNVDASMEEFNSFDPEMEFLLLDDVIPTDETPHGDKINLVEDNDSSLDEELGIEGNEAILGGGSPNQNATHLSLGGLSVTRLDRSSHMPNSQGQPTLKATDAAMRALIGTLLNEGSDASGGNLRLLNGRCDVSESGALLMPGSSIMPNNASSKRNSSRGIPEGDGVIVDPPACQEVPNAAPEEDDADSGCFVHDDHDDGGCEGVGFQLAATDEDQGETEENEDKKLVPPPVARTLPASLPSRPLPNKPDPWSLLDPHDAAGSKARPLRIGVTYRLPYGLEDAPSASVTGARTRRKPNLRPESRKRRSSVASKHACLATATFETVISTASEVRRSRHTGENCARGNIDERSFQSEDNVSNKERGRPSSAVFPMKDATTVPLRGLAFGDEFSYVAKADAKRKAAERREQRKILAENPAASIAGVENGAADDFDYDHDEGGFDFGADDDSVGGGYVDENNNNLNNPDGNTGATSNIGMASLDDAFAGLGPAGERDGDSPNYDAETFEALCRAHIKAFAKGAEKYASETQLTRRVGEWQSRLLPILESEEERPEFDIHRYGDRILTRVKNEIDSKKFLSKREIRDSERCGKGSSQTPSIADFRAVTKNCEKFEVCRLFLASLMLSNSGNVLLSHDGSGAAVATPGSLQIQLLDGGSKTRAMEGFLAPSAAEANTSST